ncbi:hypothetical protein [Thaumasiovibrio subtropicus]|uniref:hypothetical protein n=1 Tax=Thaumasiovibrio subtropicus TaxID=1891207 RepID=UPI000B3603C1|nr:hypothetical protein [Thaumasiovibrio subtropicus]
MAYYPTKGLIKFSIWWFSIISVIAMVLWRWIDIREKTVSAAYELSQRTMLDTANAYKAQWLVSGRPEKLTIEEDWVWFSQGGWPYRVDEKGKIDCFSTWLLLSRGVETVFSEHPEVDSAILRVNELRCIYRFKNEKALEYAVFNDTMSLNLLQ